MAEISNGGISRQVDPASSEGSITDANVENGEAAFETKEPFVKRDASGAGGSEDLVGEVEG